LRALQKIKILILIYSGSTALHLAVAAECADGVQKLLGHGANPNQRDAAGRSALDVAGHMPHAADIVRLLSKVAGI